MKTLFEDMKQLQRGITNALQKAGVKRSEVGEYVIRDDYGVAARHKQRTKALRHELEILVEDSCYVIKEIEVNALKQVVITHTYNN